MTPELEKKFQQWAKPPSTTDQERCSNAERIVKNAIQASDALANKQTSVFAQGSYRNRTNFRIESDVDIGILCKDTFYFHLPDGVTREELGIAPATYHYPAFKADVARALSSYVGANKVIRGNKALDMFKPMRCKATRMLKGFVVDQERQILRLAYMYSSRPKLVLAGRSLPHDGAAVFDVIEAGKGRQLRGRYWTERQTTGEMHFQLYTEELLYELPESFPDHPMSAKASL